MSVSSLLEEKLGYRRVRGPDFKLIVLLITAFLVCLSGHAVGAASNVCPCSAIGASGCGEGCVSCGTTYTACTCQVDCGGSCSEPEYCDVGDDFFEYSRSQETAFCQKTFQVQSSGCNIVDGCKTNYYAVVSDVGQLECVQCPDCGANGICDVLGLGGCDCINGYKGVSCQYSDSTTCNGNGQTDYSGSCKCDAGWDGVACDECALNFWSPDPPTVACEPCGCENEGECNPTTGVCTCISPFDGADCTACESGYFPAGACGTYCNDTDTCNGRGTCDSNGECACESSFGPNALGTRITTTCDCMAEHWGSNCTQCSDCNGHGSCDEGMTGDGTCACFDDYWGEECELEPPFVGKVNPTSGSTKGGDFIVISGTFPVIDVEILMGDGPGAAGEAYCNVTENSGSAIECETPPSNSGPTNIQFTWTSATDSRVVTMTSAFTYAAPQITSITPRLDCSAPATSLTITGTNLGFIEDVVIEYGTVARVGGAIDTVSTEHDELVFALDPSALNNADRGKTQIHLIYALGEVSANYTFAAPKVTSVHGVPAPGVNDAPSLLTIKGVNFGYAEADLSVTVGIVGSPTWETGFPDAAEECGVQALVNDSMLTCRAPPGVGVAWVQVSRKTRGDTQRSADAAELGVNTFAYLAPVVTSVSGCDASGSATENCHDLPLTLTVAGNFFGPVDYADGLQVEVDGTACAVAGYTDNAGDVSTVICELNGGAGKGAKLPVGIGRLVLGEASATIVNADIADVSVSFAGPVLTGVSYNGQFDEELPLEGPARDVLLFLRGTGWDNSWQNPKVFLGYFDSSLVSSVLLDKFECCNLAVTVAGDLTWEAECEFSGAGQNLDVQMELQTAGAAARVSNILLNAVTTPGVGILAKSLRLGGDESANFNDETTHVTVTGVSNLNQVVTLVLVAGSLPKDPSNTCAQGGTVVSPQQEIVEVTYGTTNPVTVPATYDAATNQIDLQLSQGGFIPETGVSFTVTVGVGERKIVSAPGTDIYYPPARPNITAIVSADCDDSTGVLSCNPSAFPGTPPEGSEQIMLTIQGTDFGVRGAAQVFVGGKTCPEEEDAGVVGSKIVCKLPAGLGVSVPVVVEVDGLLTSDPYTINYNPPVIESMESAACERDGEGNVELVNCPRAGGDVLTISGYNFGNAGSVAERAVIKIGTEDCSVDCAECGQTDTEIRCLLPTSTNQQRVLVIQNGGQYSVEERFIQYELCAAGTRTTAQGDCEDCEEGTFTASEGEFLCVPCPSGKFQELRGQAECKDCESGRSASELGTMYNCTACTAGTAVNFAGASQCQSCLPGRVSSVKGAQECNSCEAGRYQTLGGKTECIDCEAGKYQTLSGSTECLVCQAGTFNPTTAQVICQPCGVGNYSSPNDASEALSCLPCAVGTHASLDGTRVCNDCTKGRFSDILGASTCEECATGKFLGESGQSVCEDCTAGSFTVAPGARQCTLASSGEYSATTTTKQFCPAGKYAGTQGLTACQNCPVGRFASNQGSSSCTVCSAGRVAVSEGLSSCELCPGGTYLPDDGAQLSRTNCAICPAGTYSEGGAFECKPCPEGAYSGTNASQCTQCELGRYSDNTSSEACAICPEGKYTLNTGSLACTDCPGGRFKNASWLEQDHCVICSKDTYQPEFGGTECLPCSPGKHAPLPEQATTGADSCVSCQPGTFSATNGSSCQKCPYHAVSADSEATHCSDCADGEFTPYEGSSLCLSCAAGSFSGPGCDNADAGSCCLCVQGRYAGSGFSACMECEPGKFQSFQGGANCYKCDPGSYQNDTGKSSCKLCPAGTFQPEQGSDACNLTAPGYFTSSEGQESSTGCDEGEYQDEPGKGICKKCQKGRYQDLEHQSACISCIPGRYTDSEGLNKCSSCEKGTYTNATGSHNCTACAPGRFQPLVGNTTCLDAQPGHYVSGAGFSGQLRCRLGEYNTRVGAQFCTECPGGRYQNSELHATRCFDCDPGKFAFFNRSSVCELCPKGRAGGEAGQRVCGPCGPGYAQGSEGQLECEKCSKGKYSDAEEGLICNPCKSGSYSAKDGADKCDPCPVGFYQDDEGKSECKACGAGNFIPDGATCEACSSGRVQPTAGEFSCNPCLPNSIQDDTRTFCMCEEGYYMTTVQNGSSTDKECVECPPGSSCPLGTEFDTLLAAEGFWRTSNDSLTFYSCKEPVHCQGGMRSKCATGRTGPLCSVCFTGYTELPNGNCGPCPESSAGAVVYFVFINLLYVVFGCGAFWYVIRRDKLLMEEIMVIDKGIKSEEDVDEENMKFKRKKFHKMEEAREAKRAGMERRRKLQEERVALGIEADDDFDLGDSDIIWADGTRGNNELFAAAKLEVKHSTVDSEVADSGSSAHRNSMRSAEVGQRHAHARAARKSVNVMKTLGLWNEDDHLDTMADAEDEDSATYVLASYRNNQQFKIMLGLYQIVGVVATTLNFPWPEGFRSFIAVFSFLNFDVFRSNGSGCILSLSYWDNYVVQLAFPAAVFAGVLLGFYIPQYIKAGSEEANDKDVRSRRKREWLRSIKLFWFFFFVYYPSLCSAVFRMYSCTEVQGELLMTADMTIPCSGQWLDWAVLNIVFVFIYPIGVPLLFIVRLYRNRARFQKRKFQYELGILYLPYRPSLWYFEIFDMLHKLTITALVPLMPHHLQLPTGMLCAFAYLATIALTDPYYINRDLTLHVLAQVEIILVFMAIYVFDDLDAWEDPLADALFSVVLVMLIMFFFMTFLYHFQRRFRKLDWLRGGTTKCAAKYPLCCWWCKHISLQKTLLS